MTQQEIKEQLQTVVSTKFACDAEDATTRQMYESVVSLVLRELQRRRKIAKKEMKKQVAPPRM